MSMITGFSEIQYELFEGPVGFSECSMKQPADVTKDKIWKEEITEAECDFSEIHRELSDNKIEEIQFKAGVSMAVNH